MTRTVSDITLPPCRLGTRRALAVHRFGRPGARPKVHIQAGLHADEVPGMLVAHHLVARLDNAEGGGEEVTGEVVVVPVANPIGLDQVVEGTLVGRHSLNLAGNFNRAFPDLAEGAAARVRGRLGPDAAANVALVRQALAAAHAEMRPEGEVAALRHILLGLALDADIVLDLHCDQEAVMHLYTAPTLWPDAADLAAVLGCHAVLLAEESGGDPFDEACSSVWSRLRRRLGNEGPIPPACLAATVELRGQADVDDALAGADADALFRFLQRRGAVTGAAGPLPGLACAATPLDGADRVTTPVPGVVAFRHRPGDRVSVGTVVAEVVDPMTGTRTPLRSRTDGVLWMRTRSRVVGAFEVVASVAGAKPLAAPGGKLLMD